MFPHSRPRVLLADDYVRILTVVKRLLEPSCEIVGEVADGSRLLEAVARLQPDVIVVDVNLPGLNGLNACEHIKGATRSTQIVVLTGDEDFALERRAFELGASAFVENCARPMT